MYIYMSLFLQSEKNEVIPVSLYIFDFISTKCKILYLFFLFAQSTINLTDFLYFFISFSFPPCIENLIDFLYIFTFLFLHFISTICFTSRKWIIYITSKR